MSYVSGDRVKETATVVGVGNVALLGAVSTFQTFAAIGGVGDTFIYSIVHQSAAEWEVGIGTLSGTGNTLIRSRVLASSNAGALVNFSAGTKDVFNDWPANFGLIPPSAIEPKGDTVVPSKSSVIVKDRFKIASGKVLRIESGSVFAIR